MEAIVVIKSSKDIQKNCLIGKKLEKEGYKVNYELTEGEANKNIDILVIIIDDSFSFFKACNYLIELDEQNTTMIWVLAEQEFSDQERNILYKLGVCICFEQTTENDDAIHSINNVIKILKGAKQKYTLNKSKRSLIVNESEKELTPKEYTLFDYLNEHINEVVSYDTCCQILWSRHIDNHTTRIANIVHSLRSKIACSKEISIKTIRGKGYMLIRIPNSIIQNNCYYVKEKI